MWLIKIQKAESLLELGQLREARDILDQCEQQFAHLQPDGDLGLALHQLGNAFVRAGDLDFGDKAFKLAIRTRQAVLNARMEPKARLGSASSGRPASPLLSSLESVTDLRNHLAGSHKMRAEVLLLKLINHSDARVLPEARKEIEEAIRIRQELLAAAKKEGREVPVSLFHNFAMTLNTQGRLEGTVYNFKTAMPALEHAAKAMRELVTQASQRWLRADAEGSEPAIADAAAEYAGLLPDLGSCLADVVLYGIGARSKARKPPPLKEAEECFNFYNDELAGQLLQNSEVLTKYCRFIGHAAVPAAYFCGRADRASVFLESGMETIDGLLRSTSGNANAVARAGMLLCSIPPPAVAEMVKHGFSEERFVAFCREVTKILS
jgi:tetratricopeptide (TPR) repeat protein